MSDYPTCDFYDPPTYPWTEHSYEVRQAIKRWSERAQAEVAFIERLLEATPDTEGLPMPPVGEE